MKMTLKTIRDNIGLTQEQVSELTGVPVKTLRNWEQGIRNPSEWTLDFVADKILSMEMKKHVALNENGDDEISVLSFSTIKRKVSHIAKELDIEKIYLFGSYVSGDATPLSDVDIYMESNLFGLDYFEFAELVREKLHKKIDLLSNKTVIQDSLMQHKIMKTGVVIYER
ncbi:MAG: nucleotidyltransferase domain-containing protein [Candidatus Izimaplasma sp.]|nr:nucleotidyltransferase domain-containing protein [Candidatus Izimaplasma bacterium]